MSTEPDPPRLRDLPDPELAELLPGLQRAREEGPDAAALARICAGVATRAIPPVADPTQAIAPSSSQPASSSAAPAAPAVKLVKVLLVAAAVGSAVYFARPQPTRVPADQPSPPAQPQQPARVSPVPLAAPPAMPPPQPPVNARAPSGAGVRRTATAGSGAPRGSQPAAEVTPAAEAPTPAQPTDIVAELALLKRARVHVRANPERALALSAEHAQRFAHGTLAEEREVIAIEALLELHSSRAALERARSFFAAYPGSAHGRRVRSLLSEHGVVLSDENRGAEAHSGE